MKPWIDRPPEIRNLFNPAFCSTLIAASSFDYGKGQEHSLPFPVAFMLLPILLHEKTREKLPSNTRTTIPAWLQSNPDILIGFYERLIALKPFTREAIHFGMTTSLLTIDRNGQISTSFNSSRLTKTQKAAPEEIGNLILKSRFLGKWLNKLESVETLLALWGIRP